MYRLIEDHDDIWYCPKNKEYTLQYKK